MGVIDEFNSNVLERILKLKNERNMTDKALEDALGLKGKTIDSWKRGKSKGYLKCIDQIAQYFGISTDYLLGLKDD